MSRGIFFFRGVFLYLMLSVVSHIRAESESSWTTLYYYPDGLIGQSYYYQCTPNRVDGSGLKNPQGIAVDRNVTPNHLYVADTDNNRVLVWANIDDAFSGKSANLVLGQPDMWSNIANFGGVSPLTLSDPRGLDVAPNGDLYVCDSANHRVLVFHPPVADDNSPDGLFGQSSYSTKEPNNGGSISPVGFDFPVAVEVDQYLDVYIADSYNNRILFFTSPMNNVADAVIGQNDFESGLPNMGLANPTDVSLYFPGGLSMDPANGLWVSDHFNNRLLYYNTPPIQYSHRASLKKAQPDFYTSYYNWDGVYPQSNEPTFSTGVKFPYGVCVDVSGRLYVADNQNSRVLRWNTPASSSLPSDFVFGQKGNLFNGQPNFNGVPDIDTLNFPYAMDYDSQNRLYIADSQNNRILRYSSPLTSPNADGVSGQSTYHIISANLLDGTGFDNPHSVAIDVHTLPHTLYIADTANHRVLGWNSVMSAIRGEPAQIVLGQADVFTNTPGCSSSKLNSPVSVTIDALSNVWVSDQNNHRIVGYQNPFLYDTLGDYLIGQISWTGGQSNGGGSTPNAGTLFNPEGISIDTSNALWVADGMNHRVLCFPNPYQAGAVATIVLGQQSMYTNYPNYPFLGPQSLYYPSDVTKDNSGNLFVCDSLNNRVLLFTPPYGIADRVFGQLDDFYTNEEDVAGTVSALGLHLPVRIAVDNNRDMLFITDKMNHRVLGYFRPALNNGDTRADIAYGSKGCMDCESGGIKSGSSPIDLYYPMGVTVDSYSNLYVADAGDHRVLVFHVPEPPTVKAAVYHDLDGNSLINAGDRVILQFDQALRFTGGGALAVTDFNLPRAGDSLGEGFQTFINPLKRNNLIVALGQYPSLVIEGSGPGSSSIDVTTSASRKIVSLFTDMPVLPSGPQDLKYMLKSPPPQQFGPGGGTLQILTDPNALFTRHKLYLPPGSVTVHKALYWFSISAPDIDLPYLSAVRIRATSEAYITLEYSEDGIDTQGGYLEKYMRLARMVESSPGVWTPDWKNAPVIIDFQNNTITGLLGDLFPPGGGNGKGTSPLYGIDGEIIIGEARKLVEENSVNMQIEGGGGWGGKSPMRASSACLSPGPDSIYVAHQLCVPGYVEIPSGGYTLTIRQAVAAERSGFPDQSGAIFVIESSPDFPDSASFDLRVQYVSDPDPDITDVVTLDSAPGPVGKLRLVKKNIPTGEFEFVTDYDSVSFTENTTVTTEGLSDLTYYGVGIYGLAVNPDAENLITSARVWTLYE